MYEVRETYQGITDDQLNEIKDRDFAGWLKNLVGFTDTSYPQWFRDFVLGPNQKITKAHMYITRGYVFHTFVHGEHKSTTNYGVLVKGETDFYGILKEVIEVDYPGLLNLKTVLFKCDWFDHVINRGVRKSKFGVVDVNMGRSYEKFEPFIIASQADQVCYIPYPQVHQTYRRWAAAIKVTPRGRIIGTDVPLQQDKCENFVDVGLSTQIYPLNNPQNELLEDLPDTSDNDIADEIKSSSSEDGDEM